MTHDEPGEPVPYGELLDLATGDGLESVAAALRRRDESRTRRLFMLLAAPLVAPGLDEALCVLADAATELETSPLLRPAGALARRARIDLEQMVEAFLAGDQAPFLNTARDLMEIEWLIRDFAAVPRHVAQWARASDKERRKFFSPAALRERIASREHPGMDLPDMQEYQAHSEGLHVNPHSYTDDVDAFAADLSWATLVFYLHEIFAHATRVVAAFDALFAAVLPEARRPGAPSALADAARLCAEVSVEVLESAGLQVPLREPIPKTRDRHPRG